MKPLENDLSAWRTLQASRLRLSSATVQPGDTVRVDVDGAAPTDWIAGVAMDLEVFRRSRWERVYLLLVDWQGPPRRVPAADDLVIPAIGLKPGPFNVLIPEVPNGQYRVRRACSPHGGPMATMPRRTASPPPTRRSRFAASSPPYPGTAYRSDVPSAR